MLLVAIGCHAGAQAAEFNRGDWPMRPLARPAVPEVKSTAWPRNTIDQFVLERLERKGLAPNEPADKLTLLRRVTFDLIGLPPTPEEQEAFLADPSPDAYEKVVDRLLASPHHGERWAQHWLDVVRYSETAGFKIDNFRPDAHKYRDWVVRAMNSDLGYDRFIALQLAGDELAPNDPEAAIATGFLRLYPEETNASNFRLGRQEILDEVTDVAGLTFLGLTIGCAKCHDHKFDPILQSDFYRLQAFFTPMVQRDDIAAASKAEREAYQQRLAAWEAKTAAIRAEIDVVLDNYRQSHIARQIDSLDADTQEAVRTPAEKRTAFQVQLVALSENYVRKRWFRAGDYLEGAEKAKFEELSKQLAQFAAEKPEPLPTVMAVSDVTVSDVPKSLYIDSDGAAGPARLAPPATHRLATGNYRKPLEEVQAGFPEFLGASAAEVLPPEGKPDSTGRRSALARWLTRPDHPLTARVMVNRIWQHHFGQGIIDSPNDLGVTGGAASHPELLDWLASEFIARGWSMKAMHRLMVTSAAYRQSSTVDHQQPTDAKGQEVDHENRLLWHARRERLEGEVIRDALLQTAGRLNPRMFGPSARPELPADVMTSRYAWEPDPKPEDRNRRSIYVLTKRNMRFPLLAAFDSPDLLNSCARRTSTITAPQALVLLNSEFTLSEARHWAGSLASRFSGNWRLIIQRSYREAFGRVASEAEIRAGEHFLAAQSARIAAEGGEAKARLLPEPAAPGLPVARGAALVDYCHALMNCSEFIYVD